MAAHPEVHLLAFPGCGSGLLARVAHDLMAKFVFAWDPTPNIEQYYDTICHYSVDGMGVKPSTRPLEWEPTEPVDAVVMSEVLEHCVDPLSVLHRNTSSLKPGGYLVAIVPNGPLSPDGDPPSVTNLRLRSFTPRSLRTLTQTWHAPTLIRDKFRREYLVSVLRKPKGPARSRRIALYCPAVPESWDWRSLETGIGGSEEAVIRLSRVLASRGHTVTVYGDTDGQDGDVTYRTREDYQPSDLCIVWRFPEAVLSKNAPRAEFTWLLMEDIVSGESFARASERVDRILAMSQWHVGLYPQIAHKMSVVGNGVDPAEFLTTNLPRDPHKFLWASCPTRGLETLLESWPKIRAAVPDATLDIYYGYDMIRAILPYKAGEELERLQEKIETIDRLKDQPGVAWKGRVGHTEIAQAMMGAGVFAYPTDFDELFSVTAAKMQAAGCWPVIFERAALAETVAFGWKSTPEFFVQDCIEAALSPEDREPMRQWARTVFDWNRVAEDVDRLMETV
jgi:glycosyltransferase involved in cell wall biosynthesis